MRRPRPHRLTGSVRRLLAAVVLGGLGTLVVVTATSGPASAAGLNLNLNVNLGAGALGLSGPLPGVPSLPPLPSGSAPVTPPATLPNAGSIPNLCPPNCVVTGPPNSTGTGSAVAGTATGTSRPGSGGGRSHDASSGAGSAAASASSATTTVTSPQSLGLSVAPPPPVDPLTPLAGISFGQAPYLWPLFLLLDLIAAGAVVLLVRRTWSPNSGAD